LRIRYGFLWDRDTPSRFLDTFGRPSPMPDLVLIVRVTNQKQGSIEVEGFRLRLPPYGALKSMELDTRYGYESNPALPHKLEGKTSRLWYYNLSAQADAESAKTFKRRRCRFEAVDGFLWGAAELRSAIIVRTGDGKKSKLGLTRGYDNFRYAHCTLFLIKA
jgi:hypothetical protein